jgi:hypothetical protein
MQANALQTVLQAALADVHKLAALDILMVQMGTAPAALVDCNGGVEDVVRGGFEVGRFVVYALDDTDAVDGLLAVGDVGDVDDGAVDATGPVCTWGWLLVLSNAEGCEVR